MTTEQESTWGTWYGKRIKVSELSHQHLSNIVWYFELVLGSGFSFMPQIQYELDTRFGGIKLPYQPMISFTHEIQALKRYGYTTGEPNADIMVDGKWVGKIVYS